MLFYSWEKPHLFYGQLLDWIRYLVCWQPLIVTFVQGLNHLLGLEWTVPCDCFIQDLLLSTSAMHVSLWLLVKVAVILSLSWERQLDKIDYWCCLRLCSIRSGDSRLQYILMTKNVNNFWEFLHAVCCFFLVSRVRGLECKASWSSNPFFCLFPYWWRFSIADIMLADFKAFAIVSDLLPCKGII